MNSVSPFSFRKLTPEQERAGRQGCLVILITLCLFASLTYAMYIPFKAHSTEFDNMTAGLCIVVATISLRELWRETQKLVAIRKTIR